jgi:hypothetical protein
MKEQEPNYLYQNQMLFRQPQPRTIDSLSFQRMGASWYLDRRGVGAPSEATSEAIVLRIKRSIDPKTGSRCTALSHASDCVACC